MPMPDHDHVSYILPLSYLDCIDYHRFFKTSVTIHFYRYKFSLLYIEKNK